ncbi:MAG TPA: hypothetical protein VHF89_08050 [Solirubrobacteraceae bacterium]|nr:hypothetical protein [Solirubrobacteraceae bacterium]
MEPRALGNLLADVRLRDEELDRPYDPYAEARRFRRDHGLPCDDATIERLVRAGDGRVEGLWLEPHERDAYFDMEDRVRAAARAARAYGARQEAFGGVTADYSGTGGVEVRFTGELERHEAALRELVPEPVELRVRRVPRTEAELEALTERLVEDEDLQVGVIQRDDDAAVLRIDVVAPDAGAVRALVRERYGDAVVVDRVVPAPTEAFAESWQAYEADGARVTVHYVANATYSFERVEAEEGDDEVRITVFERRPVFLSRLPATRRSATAVLERPLGGRRVVDGATGRARDAVPG